MQASKILAKKSNEEYFGHALKEPNVGKDGSQNPSGANLHHPKESSKTNQKFIERMLDKLLNSFEVQLQDTIINFVAYVDDDKKIEESNIKKFY